MEPSVGNHFRYRPTNGSRWAGNRTRCPAGSRVWNWGWGGGAERWKAARARPEFESRASWPRLEPARELAAAHGERGR